MKKSFETLKEAFPVFEVRNKRNVSKNILLANNEEVVVPPSATVKLESKNFIQVPDTSNFKLIVPTLDALIEHNVIKVTPPANPPEKKEENSGKGSGGKS